MAICNGDYVVYAPSNQGNASLYRSGIVYRVVATELRHGEVRLLVASVDTSASTANRAAYNFYPAELFQRVYVRPAGVPEHWEIVRVGMPAEWEYYQDPVDGLIYQSVIGALPPYAAVNVVRSTGPQERGMPSHNKKYETVKQNDCQGVSPSKGIPSEISGKEDLMMDVVGTGTPMVRRGPQKGLPIRKVTPDDKHDADTRVGNRTQQSVSDTHAVRSKQMGWSESTAVEAEAWADLQEQYDVWTETLKQDGQEITLHQFLVSDDIDESSGCWRMVIATQEWVDTMQYKRCVKRATIGTHVVPKTS